LIVTLSSIPSPTCLRQSHTKDTIDIGKEVGHLGKCVNQFKGFFELKTPRALLTKLRHDYERLQRSPTDTYAAFDFFVTGYHILDWLYPNDREKRKRKEQKETLLQVISHIANGAKHFEARAKQHQSVKDVRVQEGAFQQDAFQPNAFQVGQLIIQLDGKAASEFGAEVECLALATRVLQYWENNPDLKQL
jgi:hypothetical protein